MRAANLWSALLACACAACASAGQAPNAQAPVAASNTTAAAPAEPKLECGPTPVAFEEVNRVVAKRCTSCHSPNGMAGEDYDWTNPQALAAHRRNVGAQVGQGSMPPAGYPRPSAEEQKILLCWAQAQSSASSN